MSLENFRTILDNIPGDFTPRFISLHWDGERFVGLRDALANERPYDINICAKCGPPHSGSYAGRTFKDKVTDLLFARMWNR
jgi:hypothetical protein